MAGKSRVFEEGEFWRQIPGYSGFTASQFLDPAWQSRSTVRSSGQLRAILGDTAEAAFCRDLDDGLMRSSMTLRVTPYILALIDWGQPYTDPLRRQFMPLASELEPDHPALRLDSLDEQAHSPVPGLVRRYPDKALLLPLNSCPTYCVFCTRSYAVGPDSAAVAKAPLRPDRARWQEAFDWLKAEPQVQDLVVSGGDAYNLSPAALTAILGEVLQIPSIRRIRLATKGLAVLPSRIARGDPWTEAFLAAHRRARTANVALSLHTHFNHPREITWVTEDAANLLFQEGVVVRNQSVLLRGVNDDAVAMNGLLRRLGQLNIQPYYVYVQDMVPGTEHLRTSLQTAIDLEKQIRGSTAGFYTPLFVVDLPGGGGKRDVHSYETYDPRSGRSTFRSPVIDPQRTYTYMDPERGLVGRAETGSLVPQQLGEPIGV